MLVPGQIIRGDRKTMMALIECEIVEVKDITGEPATLEMAETVPQLVEIHAMSGIVLKVNDVMDDCFTLEVIE